MWRRLVDQMAERQQLRLFGSLVRRAALPLGAGGLVLMIGAGIIATNEVEYAASSTWVVVESPSIAAVESSSGRVIDPLTQSGLARLSATQVGDIIFRVFQSPERHAELQAEGLVGRYEITTKRSVLSDTPDHGPVVVFTAFGPTPDSALADVALLEQDMQHELDRRQEGFDPVLNVTVSAVSPATSALPVQGSRMRSAVAVLFLAGVTTRLAWVGAERVRGRQARRREADAWMVP